MKSSPFRRWLSMVWSWLWLVCYLFWSRGIFYFSKSWTNSFFSPHRSATSPRKSYLRTKTYPHKKLQSLVAEQHIAEFAKAGVHSHNIQALGAWLRHLRCLQKAHYVTHKLPLLRGEISRDREFCYGQRQASTVRLHPGALRGWLALLDSRDGRICQASWIWQHRWNDPPFRIVPTTNSKYPEANSHWTQRSCGGAEGRQRERWERDADKRTL